METKYALLKVLTNQRMTKRMFKRLRGPYSQFEMANKIGVAPTNVYEWENLKVKPRAATIRKIVDHFLEWTKRYKIDPMATLSLSNKQIEDLERKRDEKV